MELPALNFCIQFSPVYYRVERTYLTSAAGASEQSLDPRPYLSAGSDSADAALAFIAQDHARLLGSVSALPGDKALASAWSTEERLFVIFVQRGVETLQFDSDLKQRDAEAVRRTGGESSGSRPPLPRR